MAQIPVRALAVIMLITMGLLHNEADAACCTEYSSYKVPTKFVRGYRIQNTNVCRLKAVILITAKGRKVCADPNQDWVMEIVANLPVQVIKMRRTQTTKG